MSEPQHEAHEARSPHGGRVFRYLPSPEGQHVVRNGRAFGLGRHVNHDPSSRRYTAAPTAAPTTPVFWPRQVPIFDQGRIGSCTANALLGILGTEPYFSALKRMGLMGADGQIMLRRSATSDRYWDRTGGRIPFTEDGAGDLYHEITENDPFDGTYPPDDTGSDGLSSAKTATALGLIPGYEHTFTPQAAIARLSAGPLLVGTVWTEGMFNPTKVGVIAPTGAIAGGHEWIADEYVPKGARAYAGGVAVQDLVGGTTSWGTGFGVEGRFYLSAKHFATLLATDGDVIVLTPPTAPAPVPTPAPTGDPQAIAAAVRKAVDDALAGFGL